MRCPYVPRERRPIIEHLDEGLSLRGTPIVIGATTKSLPERSFSTEHDERITFREATAECLATPQLTVYGVRHGQTHEIRRC